MSGGFGSSGWDIEEADSFEESVLQCGGHLWMDEALTWLDLFLNKNPLAFPKLTPVSDIRVAKTKLRIKAKGAKVFPSYRLLFTANVETKTVTKLHVSICQPDDMLYGDPYGEEESPF